MHNPYLTITIIILIQLNSWCPSTSSSNHSSSSSSGPSPSSRRLKRESSRHKIPLSPVQVYRNRLKLLPSRELLINHDTDRRSTSTEEPPSTSSSPPSSTYSPRSYLPLPPPPPEIMSDVPNGITAPISEYLMRTPITSTADVDADNEIRSTGSGLRSRHPRFLHGMSEENPFVYYPSNYPSAPSADGDNLINDNLISTNDDKLKDGHEYVERVVRVRGRARRIKVTRRPSLIPVVIEEEDPSPPPPTLIRPVAPLINGQPSNIYDNGASSNLVDTSRDGERSIYVTPTLESYPRSDQRREHIHKCLLTDYQTQYMKDGDNHGDNQDNGWVQNELESTCKVYIDKIEELRSQCWSALSDLRAKKYVTPAEDRSKWWQNLPFG